MINRFFESLINQLTTAVSTPVYTLEVTPWYPVRLLALYRLFIAILLASLFFSEVATDTLGRINPALFALSSLVYLGLSILWLISTRLRKTHYQSQVYVQITTDIVLLTLMAHASGGFRSGLGILLIVNIGSAVLLLKGMAGFFFAALGSILILLAQFYTHLSTGNPADSYPQIGALGAALFGTAALMLILKRRVHESELLAEQRGLDIENLAQLNEQIIQQMQNGVVVVDDDLQIRLINRAAKMQLGLRDCKPPEPLEETSKELAVRFNIWNNAPHEKAARIRSPGSPFELQPHFTELGPQGSAGTLIILEDTTPYSREFQNIKLASLGRLTASIAHEIRNPLSAIQHASQLLAESTELDENDKRLTEIINQQTERMNTIIENIMQLSRKENIHPVNIPLNKWLADFKEEFCAHNSMDADDMRIELNTDDANAYFDPTQLHQVIWNLCRNSLKYGRNSDDQTAISLVCAFDPAFNAAYLEVIDYGQGVPENIQDQIFEPFYSSGNASPGLGLYIVRELCEFNQAQIRYIDRKTHRGAIFRIQFANPLQLETDYRQAMQQ